MIICRDSLLALGIDLLFSLGVMKWENATIPMRDPSQLRSIEIDAFEAEIFIAEAAQINERRHLKWRLENLKTLFDGTLGTWDAEPIDLELKDPEGKPYHARPYPVPQSQEAKLKAKIERLASYSVLRRVNCSE
jgi:hypothetical protein